jgi:hypothetical protein
LLLIIELCTGRFSKSLASLAERSNGLRTVDLRQQQEWRSSPVASQPLLRKGNKVTSLVMLDFVGLKALNLATFNEWGAACQRS